MRLDLKVLMAAGALAGWGCGPGEGEGTGETSGGGSTTDTGTTGTTSTGVDIGGATTTGAETTTGATTTGATTTGEPEPSMCEDPWGWEDLHLELDGMPISPNLPYGPWGISEILATCIVNAHDPGLGTMSLDCVDQDQTPRTLKIWISSAVEWPAVEPITIRLILARKDENSYPGTVLGYALELESDGEVGLVMVNVYASGGAQTMAVPTDVFDWTLDVSECGPLSDGGYGSCERLHRGELTYTIPDGPTLTAYDGRSIVELPWRMHVATAVAARLTPEAERDPTLCCCHGPYSETFLKFAVGRAP